ncbi:hypothetical protein TYRP_015145 [Tyrophagus putrescentiae]|nr:hypothetical protein TYRP_015145 [Tyrophagus putrescentiae]
MLRSSATIIILGASCLLAANGFALSFPKITVSTGPLLAPLETAANSALSSAASAASSVTSAASSLTSAAASLPQQVLPDAFTPPQMPGMPGGSLPGLPPGMNPMTPLRPGLILHHLIRKFIMALIRLLKSILRRIQEWVLRTSDYLELLEARNIFGPFFSRLLHRLAVWLRSFVTTEGECIGRVLCEVSDQASAFLPASLKQVLLIYFSANQDFASFYYQPLANGFISPSSCARLYSSCDQARFLQSVEQMNVTVPHFLEREEDELAAAEMESVEHNELVSSFGRSMPASPEPLPTPMAEKGAAVTASVPGGSPPSQTPPVQGSTVVSQVVVNAVAPKSGKV